MVSMEDCNVKNKAILNQYVLINGLWTISIDQLLTHFSNRIFENPDRPDVPTAY